MGSGSSKPTGPPVQHVFHGHSETPVRFSNDLVESLSSSNESNSTRAKQLELHIQNRVAAELARLEERETQLLADIEARIPAQADGDGKDDAVRELSRQKVRAEIEELRTRLHDMPQQGTLSKDVQAARDDVVKCLRSNDSRPLECWQQVEAFKKQVQAMERRFVSKTVGREY